MFSVSTRYVDFRWNGALHSIINVCMILTYIDWKYYIASLSTILSVLQTKPPQTNVLKNAALCGIFEYIVMFIVICVLASTGHLSFQI